MSKKPKTAPEPRESLMEAIVKNAKEREKSTVYREDPRLYPWLLGDLVNKRTIH